MIVTLTREYGIYKDIHTNEILARSINDFYPPYRPYFLDFLGTVVATTPDDAIRIYEESED